MTMYAAAPDVAAIAADLIATVPDHADLAGVDIVYVANWCADPSPVDEAGAA